MNEIPEWKQGTGPTPDYQPALCIYRTPFSGPSPATAEVYYNYPLNDGDIDREHVGTLVRNGNDYKFINVTYSPSATDNPTWGTEQEAYALIYEAVGFLMCLWSWPKGHHGIQ